MQHTRIATVLIGTLLIVTGLTATVAADDTDETHWQRYIQGGDIFVDCGDKPGTNAHIGGACFDLDGDERKIGVWVWDTGQHFAEHGAQEVWQRGGPDLRPAVGSVNGFVEVRSGGNTVASQAFCDGYFNLRIPTGSDEVIVYLNGPLAGNPLLTTGQECPDVYEGATEGWVQLQIQDDHP